MEKELRSLIKSGSLKDLSYPITEKLLEIEMKYDVIFEILVEPEDFWSSPFARSIPIHWNIEREGIAV